MRGFLKPSERVFFPNPGTLYKEENLFIFFPVDYEMSTALVKSHYPVLNPIYIRVIKCL